MHSGDGSGNYKNGLDVKRYSEYKSMNIINDVKIIIGVVIIFVGLRSLLDVFHSRNVYPAIWYLVVTFCFFGVGSYLLYSGIIQSKELPKE